LIWVVMSPNHFHLNSFTKRSVQSVLDLGSLSRKVNSRSKERAMPNTIDTNDPFLKRFPFSLFSNTQSLSDEERYWCRLLSSIAGGIDCSHILRELCECETLDDDRDLHMISRPAIRISFPHMPTLTFEFDYIGLNERMGNESRLRNVYHVLDRLIKMDLVETEVDVPLHMLSIESNALGIFIKTYLLKPVSGIPRGHQSYLPTRLLDHYNQAGYRLSSQVKEDRQNALTLFIASVSLTSTLIAPLISDVIRKPSQTHITVINERIHTSESLSRQRSDTICIEANQYKHLDTTIGLYKLHSQTSN
jgi:hypothetical protein